ncbi:SMP-30/gluconolactonase/LRE family protein [Tabrizicola sp. J26]|uniref:SMP-30/gluconolactonase/LRE family protein n=1 Tax=Alitabrizicola rongguiensis TaxID=2909234 RepID=UPI001F298319|nr:SMP-30/gluconolactonase/LRE family protein [Tabrizicola rongguiensis]MCF1709918.1 SMP-30/gluconolactonase/LRE family protein [Tabrizicola rongguiensis]
MRLTTICVLLTCSIPIQALADPAVVDPNALFPEGPVVVADKLLYAEYAGNDVKVWDGSQITTLWKQDGCGPSAVVPLAEGYGITCYDSGQLVVISADGATVRTYADAGGAALQGPNDGAPDGKGGAWFTMSGPWEAGPIVGRVVHLAADGTLSEVANDLHYANGIVLGPDGRLYVNESEAGRTISFAVGADGSLSDRRLFDRYYQLGEASDVYPDGIKLGPNGNFFVGLYSTGAILEVAPDGKLVTRHEVPSKAAPNLAFSADGKTMYVTAVDNKDGAPYEGKVYAVSLP